MPNLEAFRSQYTNVVSYKWILKSLLAMMDHAIETCRVIGYLEMLRYNSIGSSFVGKLQSPDATTARHCHNEPSGPVRLDLSISSRVKIKTHGLSPKELFMFANIILNVHLDRPGWLFHLLFSCFLNLFF